MTSSYWSVLKHAGIYGLGNIGIRVAGLLLVPLYTYNLSPAEYGIVEYLDLTTTFISMLFNLGLLTAVYRFYYRSEDPAERRAVVATAMIPSILLSILIAGIMVAVSPTLADHVYHDPRFRQYLTILFISFGFNAFAEFGMTYLAVLQRSSLYARLTVLKFVLGAGLNILFIVGLHLGVLGILYSNLIANAALGVPLIAHVVRRSGMTFSRSLFWEMVRYGYPMVVVQICLFIVNFSDRFFLQAFTSFEQVGIYALAYKFGIMLNTLVVASFFQVWNAKAFEVARDPGVDRFYTRVFTYFCVALVVAGLGMSLVIRDVVHLVAPQTYWRASGLVPWIVLAYVLNGLGTYFELGMKLRDKTGYLGWIFVATCVLCVGLYWVLIPRYGMFGAVAATVIAFLFKAVLVYVWSQRLVPIQFEFGRVGRLMLLAAGFLLVRAVLPPLPGALSVLVALSLLALFGFVVYASGWLRPEEKTSMRGWIREGARRLRAGAGGRA